MKIPMDKIRQLRERTGSPVMRAKQVLDQVKGDMKKAEEILKKEGFEKVEKRAGRITNSCLICLFSSYSESRGSSRAFF
jgi:elongation factor Ts